jgi:hypothetical protein
VYAKPSLILRALWSTYTQWGRTAALPCCTWTERSKSSTISAPIGSANHQFGSRVPPKAFFPLQIAVFRSGEMLISGLQYHPGYIASTAIYEPSGHLVKQFVRGGDAEIERAIELGDARYTRAPGGGNDPVSRSVAITGDDGYVYLMRATSPATIFWLRPVQTRTSAY